MNDPQITDLVIVGSGSAGWLTAGIIAAEHLKTEQSSSRVKVTLVEAPNINTIVCGRGNVAFNEINVKANRDIRNRLYSRL